VPQQINMYFLFEQGLSQYTATSDTAKHPNKPTRGHLLVTHCQVVSLSSSSCAVVLSKNATITLFTN